MTIFKMILLLEMLRSNLDYDLNVIFSEHIIVIIHNLSIYIYL